ncbi:hypothetical protein [Hymenobacter glacieicola]|uniref:TonB-dependent receptor plug domain-containing protein n=1 Tax=Hymenobacter glacieicola TaxID=1562124 RepID=A0ABQ1WMY8_9BACT|nr:hypothetical protein [Hymenobacter glacieicola]GGG38876.1 hypothetical protein GCM10011378_13980 [Hymenobacter glacieicola]
MLTLSSLRCLVALAGLLTVTTLHTLDIQAAAPAPAARAATEEPSLYFLDGQPSDQKTIEQINRRTIASVNVVKGDEARRIFGAEAGEGVMIVVTKRNVGSAAVAEFNRRYDIRPVETPAPPAAPLQP